MSILQVDQKGEDEEHDNAGQDAFSVHEGRELRAAIPTARSGTPKVNDRAAGINEGCVADLP
jgi:hypothetical protein